MTKRQRQVYDFIKDFWHQNKKGPTFREIAGHLNSAVGNAYFIVQCLEAQGYVERERYRHRTLKVTEKRVPS